MSGSKLLVAARKIQSGLFFPLNFVGNITAGAFAQGFRNASIIAASFTKKYLGRELHWDPIWKGAEEATKNFFHGWFAQTFYLASKTAEDIQSVTEEVIETESSLLNNAVKNADPITKNMTLKLDDVELEFNKKLANSPSSTTQPLLYRLLNGKGLSNNINHIRH